jgi:hypothetical protein
LSTLNIVRVASVFFLFYQYMLIALYNLNDEGYYILSDTEENLLVISATLYKLTFDAVAYYSFYQSITYIFKVKPTAKNVKCGIFIVFILQIFDNLVLIIQRILSITWVYEHIT